MIAVASYQSGSIEAGLLYFFKVFFAVLPVVTALLIFWPDTDFGFVMMTNIAGPAADDATVEWASKISVNICLLGGAIWILAGLKRRHTVSGPGLIRELGHARQYLLKHDWFLDRYNKAMKGDDEENDNLVTVEGLPESPPGGCSLRSQLHSGAWRDYSPGLRC
jgi:hypothetical protein